MTKGFWNRYLYQTIVILMLIGLFVKMDYRLDELTERLNFIQDSVLRLEKTAIIEEYSA